MEEDKGKTFRIMKPEIRFIARQKGRKSLNLRIFVPARLVVTIFSCLVLSVLSANTAPITFTFSGTGSGSASATTFTDSQFTIRLSADTANVVQVPDASYTIFSVAGCTSTIDIGGVGAGDFLSGTGVFVNQENNAVGLWRLSAEFPDLTIDLMDIYYPTFGGYDLRTSLGPVTVNDSDPTAIGQFRDISTTLGLVSFTGAKDITFTAVAVPEPSLLGLFAGAALSLIVWRQQRRRAPAR